MTGRAGEDHLVTEERLEAHAAVAPGRADDAELELALGDEVDDGLRVVDLERDANAAVAGLELAEELGHDDRCRARSRRRSTAPRTALPPRPT